MTPEQNEQWKVAVMQAYSVPGVQECSFEQWRDHRIAEASLLSLMPEARRVDFLRGRGIGSWEQLVSWQLPQWILEIRHACAWNILDSWRAEFGFRSYVALIGMQLRYFIPEARAESYERLLLGFLPRALRPLIDYAETYNQHQDFEDCYEICRLCESDDLYRAPQRWLDIEKIYFGPSKGGIENWPHTAVNMFALIAHSVLFRADELATSERGWLGALVDHLHSEYGPGLRMIPEDGIAQAFLEALEAECPPPDWLPGAQVNAP